MAVDPKVEQAVTLAKPAKVNHLSFIVRALLFHIFFVPTTALLLPLFLLRALIPFGPGRYKGWTVLEALGLFLTRYAMRNIIRFNLQPIPPREKGWREMDNVIGGFLSLVNLSGPGGLVASAPPIVDQVEGYIRDGRRDTDWFNPPPLEALKGILSIKVGDNKVTDSTEYKGAALVEPKWAKTRVKGYWFMHNHADSPMPGPSGSQKHPVVLFFHGGAGVSFSAGDAFLGQTLTKTLAKKGQIDVFSVDYNLAPFAPFPVQIVQALGGYLHLINSYGYLPEQIFIGGDSFGGWLTLQLEHYLRTDGKFITDSWKNKAPTASGVPGLLLLSPWVCPFDIDTPSRRKSMETGYDILFPAYAHWGVNSLNVGPNYKNRFPDLENPWIAPYCFPQADIAKLPPSYVLLGGLEALFDEDVAFVSRLRDAGVSVELQVDEAGCHDFGTMSTFLPRYSPACAAMGKWIQGKTV